MENISTGTVLLLIVVGGLLIAIFGAILSFWQPYSEWTLMREWLESLKIRHASFWTVFVFIVIVVVGLLWHLRLWSVR